MSSPWSRRFDLFILLLHFGYGEWAAAALAASPLSPEDELATFRLADPELRVELVAVEPEVTSPVAVAWDADGRLFVAEMNDYPLAAEGGRVRLLEDRDGDGRCEHSVVFADNLHFPASVLPWRDGVLVAAAPDVLFLRDTDGDGRADERRALLTGFAEGNQQLRVNSLTWAMDNWVYGANGRSDGEIRGGPLTAPLSLRRRDFRFRPDSGEVETLAGPSQFGLGFDAAGNRFLSWNTIPLRHEVIAQHYLDRQPLAGPLESLGECRDPNDDQRVFPLTPVPLTFNRESTSHFNALAGLHIFGGDALGAKYVGDAFMGETLRNLIHHRVLVPHGPTFISQRPASEQDREFLASSDPWFHPVNFATGPNGALYVCDFYRRWVEHPGYVPEKLRDKFDWREGAGHGRIWRIRSRAHPEERSVPTPRLSRMKLPELVELLAHANVWRRLSAQRLVIERHDREAISQLKSVIEGGSSRVPQARLHALWILAALNALDESIMNRGLDDSDARVRNAAVSLAAPRLASSPALRSGVVSLAADPSAVVRLRVALAAAELPLDDRYRVLEAIVRREVTDEWMTRAALSSCGTNPWPLAAALVRQPPPEPAVFPFLVQLGRLIGSQTDQGTFEIGLQAVLRAGGESGRTPGVAFLAGVADGIARSGRDPRRLVDPDSKDTGASAALFAAWLAEAKVLLADPRQNPSLRVMALELLIAIRPSAELPPLLEYLSPQQPLDLQLAAADRLTTVGGPEIAPMIWVKWATYSSATRRRLLAAATRSSPAVTALLSAIEHGQVERLEIDAAVRDTLRRHTDPSLRRRSEDLFATIISADRAAMIRQYTPALTSRGNRTQGAKAFAKNCSSCHRLGGEGGQVGPDLSGVATRPAEVLLVDILDPSRQVSPDFLAYSVEASDGETQTGLLVTETGGGVTLRRANLPDAMISREHIVSLRAEGKSLMPDGLEAGIDLEAMADLLAFLAEPDPVLLKSVQ